MTTVKTSTKPTEQMRTPTGRCGGTRCRGLPRAVCFVRAIASPGEGRLNTERVTTETPVGNLNPVKDNCWLFNTDVTP